MTDTIPTTTLDAQSLANARAAWDEFQAYHRLQVEVKDLVAATSSAREHLKVLDPDTVIYGFDSLTYRELAKYDERIGISMRHLKREIDVALGVALAPTYIGLRVAGAPPADKGFQRLLQGRLGEVMPTFSVHT